MYKIKKILENKNKKELFEKLSPLEKAGLFLWPSVQGTALTKQ